MLANYLVSLGANNMRKPKKRSAKAANSPQVNKERTFHDHLLMESFCIIFQKYILRQGFRLSLVLNLFLILHQSSGSCYYKIVLMKKECSARRILFICFIRILRYLPSIKTHMHPLFLFLIDTLTTTLRVGSGYNCK